MGPGGVARAIVVLLSLHSLITLILGDLLLKVSRARRLSAVANGISGQLGINGWNQGSKSFSAGLGSLALPHLLPIAPVLKPSLVVLAEVKVDVQAPVHRVNPVEFECVELGYGNTTDFGPRTILEGVVVKELAAKQQGNGQISPDLSLSGLVRSLVLHRIDSLCKIIHAKEDCRAWQPGRGQNLSDKFPEGWGDIGLRRDHSSRHLSDIFGHQLNLIVEDSAYTARHVCGW